MRLRLPTRWEDKRLVPIQLAFLTFIYNANIVKEPLQSFKDLIQSPHKIILSDPRTSTPGQSLLYWIKTTYGKDSHIFWDEIKPRILTITKSWSDAYSLFLKGEAPIVISYTTSELYHKLQENRNDIVASYFQEGQYMEVLVGGILKSSPNHELADKFILELLEEPFQKAVVLDSWCYPVVAITDLPSELKVHPKFVSIDVNGDWDSFKTEALDEWLETLSS